MRSSGSRDILIDIDMKMMDALICLQALCGRADDVTFESGERDGVVSLRMRRRSDPDRTAVVCTPGDRWFEVNNERGYAHIVVEEGGSDDDVRAVLQRMVEIALAYVRSDLVPVKPSRFRASVVIVPTEHGDATLSLSLLPSTRAALRRTPQPR